MTVGNPSLSSRASAGTEGFRYGVDHWGGDAIKKHLCSRPSRPQTKFRRTYFKQYGGGDKLR
jgi:hypothetical protein